MLIVGLSTEAVIFIMSVLEPVHLDADWSRVFPELSNAEGEGVDDGPVAQELLDLGVREERAEGEGVGVACAQSKFKVPCQSVKPLGRGGHELVAKLHRRWQQRSGVEREEELGVVGSAHRGVSAARWSAVCLHATRACAERHGELLDSWLLARRR